MEKQITQAQSMEASTKSLRNAIYKVMAGAIVSYDPASQTATVQPMQNDPRQNVETGVLEGEPWPQMSAVPVAWPRFGGFCLCGPLAQHDPVVLLAWDLDPSTWLAQGPSLQPVDPADVRRHGGGYWFAIPLNLFGPVADAAAAGAAIVFGKDGDPAQIRISPGLLQLGRTGGDFVALASKVDSAIAAMKTFETTHVHSCSGSVSGSTYVGATAASSTTPPTTPATGSALIAAQ